MVPAGYESCEAVKPPVSGALATAQCGQNSSPGGPQSATYSLFQDVDALDDAFQRGNDEDTLQPCPDGSDSPGTWDYDSTPDAVEGRSPAAPSRTPRI